MVSEGIGECLYKLIRLSEGMSMMKVVLLGSNVRVQAITAVTERLGTGYPGEWEFLPRSLNYYNS